MQAPIEVSRRGVEKCFCLTSSLIGRVIWRYKDIEADAGNENISVLSNFEQPLDCQSRHDTCEQTSGEGCSANAPTRKSLGRFVLGGRSS